MIRVWQKLIALACLASTMWSGASLAAVISVVPSSELPITLGSLRSAHWVLPGTQPITALPFALQSSDASVADLQSASSGGAWRPMPTLQERPELEQAAAVVVANDDPASVPLPASDWLLMSGVVVLLTMLSRAPAHPTLHN